MQKKNISKTRIVLLTAAGLVLWGFVSQAFSTYYDLIDMPSLEMASSRYGLTLDVTQAGDRMVTVGERGHILYSDDGAKTWHQAKVDTRSHLNAVTFADDKIGWAVGEDAVIVYTTDGGTSWTRQFDDRNADLKGPLLDVWFKNSHEGFAVGVYNKIYKTVDGGISWNDWSEHVDNPDEWHLFAIAAASSQEMYLASEQGLIFRSEDGGNSFAPIQTGHFGSFHGVLARQNENGSDTIIAFGVGGVLLTSTDSGMHWNRLKTHTELGLSGATWLSDGSIIVVGYAGMLMHVDSGLVNINAHPQENGLPLSSVAALGNDQLIVVGFGGPQRISTP